jgi:hypothetical protein
LSPKSVFFALVVVGLPFAVVAGWALGAPAARQAALGMTGMLDGTGALGAAPDRAGTTPAPTDGYQSRPPRATAAPATSTAPSAPVNVVTTTVTVIATVTPPSATSSPPPLLTNPPVPTPTQIVDTPPVPTPTDASPSESPDPSETPSSPVVSGP